MKKYEALRNFRTTKVKGGLVKIGKTYELSESDAAKLVEFKYLKEVPKAK